MPYQIRWARRNEWVPAMEMIWKTFRKYEGRDFTEEGIQHFFDFITTRGAGSIRSRNILSLLFVEEAYHHKGVGSAILERLCEYLRTEEGERFMTLQAAPYAVDFYRKQGFRAVRPEMEFSGIRVTPMEKNFG